MKIAPVSADLLIKVALGAVAVGGLLYLVNKITGAAAGAVGDVVDSVTEAASTTFNPASNQNFIYRSVNAVGDAIALPDAPGRNADGSFTWGGWFYDVTHPATVAQIKALGDGTGGPGITKSW